MLGHHFLAMSFCAFLAEMGELFQEILCTFAAA
jgi:hypothetical protein